MIKKYPKVLQRLVWSLIAVFLIAGLTMPAAAVEKQALLTLKTTRNAQQTRQKECLTNLQGLDIERETCRKAEKEAMAQMKSLSAQCRIAGRLVTRCTDYLRQKEAALKTAEGSDRLTIFRQKQALEQTLLERQEAQAQLEALEQAQERQHSALQARLREIDKESLAYAEEISQLETSIQTLSAEIAAADALYAEQVLSERAVLEGQEQAERDQSQAEWDAAVLRAQQRWEAYQKQQQTLPAVDAGGNNSADSTDPMISGVSLLWPVPTGQRITSGFGYRLHPLSGKGDFHRGIDIADENGAAVLAADSGVVVASFYGSSYGNHILLAHPNGTSTLYAHLSSSLVSAGMLVQRGQTIGLVGSTGNSTGNHLHFELWTNGASSSRVNPVPYFAK